MDPYNGKRPEVGWSVHMTGGWKSQRDRMRRWHARALAARDSADRWDCLYAFFESALHLRDWLHDTGAATDKSLKLLSDQVPMRLCRDLANAHKHYSLQHPGSLAPPSEALEYSPGAGNLDADVSLVILSDGTKHDAFELADQVLRAWEHFLAVHDREVTTVTTPPRPEKSQ